MQRKKTRKLIKYKRQPIQQSNPCAIDKVDDVQPKRETHQPKSAHNNSEKEVLEIPRSWKLDNIVDDIRGKLLGVVTAKQSLIPVNTMFDNSQLQLIMGQKSQHLKKNFKNSKSYEQAQQKQKQRRDSANFGQCTQQHYHNNQSNYLEYIQQNNQSHPYEYHGWQYHQQPHYLPHQKQQMHKFQLPKETQYYQPPNKLGEQMIPNSHSQRYNHNYLNIIMQCDNQLSEVENKPIILSQMQSRSSEYSNGDFSRIIIPDTSVIDCGYPDNSLSIIYQSKDSSFFS